VKNSNQTPHRFFRTLYFRVLVGIVAGILVGIVYPRIGEQLKPLGDMFIKLIRMMIAPIIFFSVVVGIANIGDVRKLGRVGLKALIYFEATTTFALLLGLAVATVVQPGRGMNVDPATLDAKSVAQYTADAKHLGVVDFVLNIIPDNFVNAFSKGEILHLDEDFIKMNGVQHYLWRAVGRMERSSISWCSRAGIVGQERWSGIYAHRLSSGGEG
jgi:Na+/H+-dicarboxylate symporter